MNETNSAFFQTISFQVNKAPGLCKTLWKTVCCCECFSKYKEKLSGLTSRSTWMKLNSSFLARATSEMTPSTTKGPFLDGSGIQDSLEVLRKLYNGEDVFEFLRMLRLNPNFDPNAVFRGDLEYFIPQLCNYLIYHEEMKNDRFREFLLEACETDFFFGHLTYWYLFSLTADESFGHLAPSEIRAFVDQIVSLYSVPKKMAPCIASYNRNFVGTRAQNSPDDLEQTTLDRQQFEEQFKEILEVYRKDGKWEGSLKFTAPEIPLKEYGPVFIDLPSSHIAGHSHVPFLSNVFFYGDLMTLGYEMIAKHETRDATMLSGLDTINGGLPAAVYIPFTSERLRHYVILNIVISEARVFSTKERAPFAICLELFRPDEEQLANVIYIEAEENGSNCEEEDMGDSNLDRFQQQTTNRIHTQGDEYKKKKTKSKWNLEKLTKFRLWHYNKTAEKNQKSGDEKFLQLDLKLSLPKTINTRDILGGLKLDTNLDISVELPEGFKDQSSMDQDDFDGIDTILKSSRNAEVVKEIDNYISHLAEMTNQIPCHKKSLLTESIPANKPSSGGQPCRDKEADSRDNEIQVSFNKNELSSSLKKSRGKKKNYINLDDSNVDRSQMGIATFGEESSAISERIRAKSPFKHLASWRLAHLIIKAGDDLKQEQFAMQLISAFNQIFKAENLKLIVRPYEVQSLGPNFGIVERVMDTITIDKLKKTLYTTHEGASTLSDWFKAFYPKESIAHARENFCLSLAAYSLITYFLQIKDRHNGNILLHRDGYIIHIDFGFFLSHAPGEGIKFENAPFKLLNEYVDVLGGARSKLFEKFREYFYK